MIDAKRVWTEDSFIFWRYADGTVAVDDSEGREVARFNSEDDWQDAVSTFFLSLS